MKDQQQQQEHQAHQFSVPSVPEQGVQGWDLIWERFFHREVKDKETGRVDLRPYFSLSKLQRRYGQELMDLACVTKHYQGRQRVPAVIGWPSRIVAWIQLKQAKGEF